MINDSETTSMQTDISSSVIDEDIPKTTSASDGGINDAKSVQEDNYEGILSFDNRVIEQNGDSSVTVEDLGKDSEADNLFGDTNGSLIGDKIVVEDIEMITLSEVITSQPDIKNSALRRLSSFSSGIHIQSKDVVLQQEDICCGVRMSASQ